MTTGFVTIVLEINADDVTDEELRDLLLEDGWNRLAQRFDSSLTVIGECQVIDVTLGPAG